MDIGVIPYKLMFSNIILNDVIFKVIMYLKMILHLSKIWQFKVYVLCANIK